MGYTGIPLNSQQSMANPTEPCPWRFDHGQPRSWKPLGLDLRHQSCQRELEFIIGFCELVPTILRTLYHIHHLVYSNKQHNNLCIPNFFLFFSGLAQYPGLVGVAGASDPGKSPSTTCITCACPWARWPLPSHWEWQLGIQLGHFWRICPSQNGGLSEMGIEATQAGT